MTDYINGVATAPSQEGSAQILESYSNGAKITGSGDMQANGGNDTFYGLPGNDTFIITSNDLMNSSGSTDNINALNVIWNFGGAGGFTHNNNDFLALEGFGAGSTLTFANYGHNADGSTNVDYQFYTLHDTTSGNNYTIFVNSTDGQQLSASNDYAFY